MMGKTIALIFDEESQIKINNIRNILNKNNIKSNYFINHISLVGFIEDIVLKDDINNIIASFLPIELEIINSNIFLGEVNTLYLEFENSKKLFSLQKDTIKKLNRLDIKHFYINEWVPHSTVAINLTKEETIRGKEILNSNVSFPIKVKLDSFKVL